MNDRENVDGAFIRGRDCNEVGTEVEVEGKNVRFVGSSPQFLQQGSVFSQENSDESSFFRSCR